MTQTWGGAWGDRGYLTPLIHTAFCLSFLFNSTDIRSLLMHLNVNLSREHFTSYFCTMQYKALSFGFSQVIMG